MSVVARELSRRGREVLILDSASTFGTVTSSRLCFNLRHRHKLRLFLDRKMLLIVPAAWASNFFYSYQFNIVNGLLFNLRTRGFNNVFYWGAQMVGSISIGYVMDFSFKSRRARGFARISLVAVIGTAIWAGGLVNQHGYSSKDLPDKKLDFKDSGSGFVGPFLLYMCYGLLDAMYQSMVYWLIGALADDSQTLSRYSGFYKGVQSAGAAVAWQVDTRKVPLMSQLIVNWSLTTNGVAGLRMMEGFEAMKMEPELRCVKALLSPESGIVDSHSLMLSLVGEAENRHATFSYNTVVLSGRVEEKKLHLFVAETGSLESQCEAEAQLELIPDLVVNSAGLGAQALAKRFHGLDHRVIPLSHYARGCYFTLSGTKSPPFKNLVYPIPEEGGLGVHVTVDLNGAVKFGPDVEWIECTDEKSSFLNKFDYRVNPQRAEKFYPEIRKYYPDVKDGSLEPGYSGIRPKLSGPKQPPADFVIQGEETHGVPGLVNLFGIESPGLTSSLAIAEHIANKFSR